MPVTDAGSAFIVQVAPPGTPASATSPIYRLNSRGGIDIRYGDGLGGFIYAPPLSGQSELNARYKAALAAQEAANTASPGLTTVIPKQWLADP